MAWLSGWTYRKKLTIDHTLIPSDQHVRLPIILDEFNFDFTKIQVEGQDFRVTDSDGETLLPYQIENLGQSLSSDGLDDDSSYNHAASFQGSAAVNTTDSKFGDYSLALNGSGSYASVDDNAVWDFGSSDFCIEAFVKLDDLADNTIVARSTSGTSYFYFTFEGGNLRFRDYDSGNNIDFSRGVSLSTGVWYHVAVTRNGSDFRMFLDGVQQGATHTSANAMLARAVPMDIGHMTQNASYALNGRIDSIRITVGDAVYTSNFTPPSSELTTGVNTALLMTFEIDSVEVTGATLWTRVPTVSSSIDREIYLYYGNAGASDDQNAASVWQDYTAVWHLTESPTGALDEIVDSTGNGHDAQAQGSYPTTAEGIVGNALKGLGSGSYLTAPDDPNLELTGDFELSWKMYWVGSVSNGAIFGKSQGGGPSPKWILNYGNLVGGAMGFHDGSGTVSWAWSPSPDTWYHCRLKRSGNDFKFFVNGSQVGSTVTSALSVPATTQAWHFFAEGESWQWFSGRLDEVRLLNFSTFSDDVDSIQYYSDSDQLLTYGSEEGEPASATTGSNEFSFEWNLKGEGDINPRFEWDLKAEKESTFSFEWDLIRGVKFTPNLVNYSFRYDSPSITEHTIPVGYSGIISGYTVYMKDTGSSGNTILKIYQNDTLKKTITVESDNDEHKAVYHFDLDSMLNPLDRIRVEVTEVATDAENLDLNVYFMTFPFEIEHMYFGNINSDVWYDGLNRNTLFGSSDYWTVDFNQPIKEIKYLKLINNDIQENTPAYVIENGSFYRNRIKITNPGDFDINNIVIKVVDYKNISHVLSLKPSFRDYMARFTDYIFLNPKVFKLDVGANNYRYSFDGGSSFTSWESLDGSETISIDFSGQTEGNISLLMNYSIDQEIIAETVPIYFATGDIDVDITFSADSFFVDYTDGIPLDKINIYQDGNLVGSVKDANIEGIDDVTLDIPNKKYTINAGTFYYNGEKFVFPETERLITLDTLSGTTLVLNYADFLVFNTEILDFEFYRVENGQPYTEEILSDSNLIPIWRVDLRYNPSDLTFSTWAVSFDIPVYLFTRNLFEFDFSEFARYTVKVFDISGRVKDFEVNNTNVIFNRWNTLTVEPAGGGSEIFPGQIHQEGTLDYTFETEDWD